MEQTEFVEFWDTKYKEEKGIKYDWQKSDFGHMKKFLSYFEKQGGLEAAKQSALSYLSSKESFVEKRAWTIKDLLTNPAKWLLTAKKAEEARNRAKALQKAMKRPTEYKPDYTRDLVENGWISLNVEAFVSKVVSEASEDPETYFRRFLGTQAMLKQRNKEAWRRVSEELADLIGRDRAREMWKKHKPGLFENLLK